MPERDSYNFSFTDEGHIHKLSIKFGMSIDKTFEKVLVHGIKGLFELPANYFASGEPELSLGDLPIPEDLRERMIRLQEGSAVEADTFILQVVELGVFVMEQHDAQPHLRTDKRWSSEGLTVPDSYTDLRQN